MNLYLYVQTVNGFLDEAQGFSYLANSTTDLTTKMVHDK